MRVAVLLHVAALEPLPELLRATANVSMTGVPCDLLFNLAVGKVDLGQARQLILTTFPTARIIDSENRGMDIGGFLALLPLVLTATPRYDYVLKLHTKSVGWWRRGLIAPICGSPAQVKLCLSLFQTQARVGLIGAARYLYRESRYRKPNLYYLQQLTARLGLPYLDCQFIGGTMFWIRTSLLVSTFGRSDLAALRQQLNTPQCFDPYWYMLNNSSLGLTSTAQARQHWEVQGRSEGRYGNCLHARECGATRYLADGMLEHAYERVFGLLARAAGQIVMGV
jgi:Rhamnan synthesis protein F